MFLSESSLGMKGVASSELDPRMKRFVLKHELKHVLQERIPFRQRKQLSSSPMTTAPHAVSSLTMSAAFSATAYTVA